MTITKAIKEVYARPFVCIHVLAFIRLGAYQR
jgi:hypothetical protein